MIFFFSFTSHHNEIIIFALNFGTKTRGPVQIELVFFFTFVSVLIHINCEIGRNESHDFPIIHTQTCIIFFLYTQTQIHHTNKHANTHTYSRHFMINHLYQWYMIWLIDLNKWNDSKRSKCTDCGCAYVRACVGTKYCTLCVELCQFVLLIFYVHNVLTLAYRISYVITKHTQLNTFLLYFIFCRNFFFSRPRTHKHTHRFIQICFPVFFDRNDY